MQCTAGEEGGMLAPSSHQVGARAPGAPSSNPFWELLPHLLFADWKAMGSAFLVNHFPVVQEKAMG